MRLNLSEEQAQPVRTLHFVFLIDLSPFRRVLSEQMKNCRSYITVFTCPAMNVSVLYIVISDGQKGCSDLFPLMDMKKFYLSFLTDGSNTK